MRLTLTDQERRIARYLRTEVDDGLSDNELLAMWEGTLRMATVRLVVAWEDLGAAIKEAFPVLKRVF